DVASILDRQADPIPMLRALAEALADESNPLAQARLCHTLGSALQKSRHAARWRKGITIRLEAQRAISLPPPAKLTDGAFDLVRQGMVRSARWPSDLPRKAIKSDQIVWGRAPVRLDLAGGWTDTPPYSLEHGGAVVNVAVNLNGQPPIQVFGRVCEHPHIRLSSIDLGESLVVRDLQELLDFRSPVSRFAIAKAALAMCGFSPETRPWPKNVTLRKMLAEFGGGIELTTLCAVPKGSGLGTSSILGAVLLATLNRMLGAAVSTRDLFHQVLVLEQMMTTGGGWQDQVGGAVGGLKLVTTEPGMVPDPMLRWLPPDVFCPTRNGGSTLLYYTGLTRLAKNILQNVVGRYLDRDRESLRVLHDLKRCCAELRDAIERRDRDRFGAVVREVWGLNKALDPGSTNPAIDQLMARIQPYTLGAKVLGAGGGGFMFIICPDPAAAARCRADLDRRPPNPLARFSDFQVNDAGLEVTVS
ncbi:MAG: hypothetical protein FJ272_13935, partial [Planctomycetes bacterium]|nr:hypothetical protein [Planctomycetota bacterium]